MKSIRTQSYTPNYQLPQNFSPYMNAQVSILSSSHLKYVILADSTQSLETINSLKSKISVVPNQSHSSNAMEIEKHEQNGEVFENSESYWLTGAWYSRPCSEESYEYLWGPKYRKKWSQFIFDLPLTKNNEESAVYHVLVHKALEFETDISF